MTASVKSRTTVRSRRDQRIAAIETIGCALATLGRLDHVWYDADVRSSVTKVRATLSVAQSQLRERIDASVEERTQR